MTEKPSTEAPPQGGILGRSLKEISQPFIDLIHAPRALWGVNLAYTLEGLSYFGILTYLAIHFSDFVFQGVPHPDVWAHRMVGVLTAGIAISMVFLGFVPDRWGVRKALLTAFGLLLVGRILMSAAPTTFGLQPAGTGSLLLLVTMAGIMIVVVGYGLYQPSAYAAVRQFTTPRTASMAYAMLYALMNAGSSLAMLAFLVRDEGFLGLGITGTFWFYTGLTGVSLLATYFILSRKTVAEAIARARAEGGGPPEKAAGSEAKPAAAGTGGDAPPRVPVTAWIVLGGVVAAVLLQMPFPWNLVTGAALVLVPAVIRLLPWPARTSTLRWIAAHPLANGKFFFFIFALIPVQTLFTYNWLVLPQYISRAFAGGWIGEYYEIASNANPILIFILVPVITAATYRAKVYNMMVWGTLVMGSAAFALAFGPTPWALLAYILIMTVGEAMWSARFLQYATEIAPEGRAGQYQGVAQLPWFLTKFLVPLLYSGQMMERYCPAEGALQTEGMWFVFGLIAVTTPLMLWLARKWMKEGFGERHG
ncbi:MAG: MFS transporter [Bacteroidota bacterium]